MRLFSTAILLTVAIFGYSQAPKAEDYFKAGNLLLIGPGGGSEWDPGGNKVPSADWKKVLADEYPGKHFLVTAIPFQIESDKNGYFYYLCSAWREQVSSKARNQFLVITSKGIIKNARKGRNLYVVGRIDHFTELEVTNEDTGEKVTARAPVIYTD